MKNRIVLPLILMFVLLHTIESCAQIIGDYRSFGAGTSWATAANWERCVVNGVWPGAASATYPGQIAAVAGTTVTIRNGHSRILDVSPAFSIVNLAIGEGASGTLTVGVAANSSFTLTSSGAVTIGTGASLLSLVDTDGAHTLNFQSTLTNNGTINFAAGTEQVTLTVTSTTTNNGSLTFATNAGVKTFIGAVSNTGTWNTTGLSGTNNLIFRNGVSSTGATFTAGSATFNDVATNAQTIGGTAAMSFANVVTLTDGTIAGALVVTNSNTNTVTMSNTGAATLTGTAGAIWRQGATSTLAYAGSTITTITLDASTNANTVNYTAAAQTVSPVAYSTLGLSGSGAKTMTGVTTIGNNFNISGTASATATAAITISGNFTLAAGTFVGGAFTHNIAGNWVRNGGVFTNTGTTFNFNGAAQSIGGTVSTTFNNVTITSGTTTLSFATAIAGTFEINNGTAVNLGGLTTHTANRLTFGGRGESAGTWGGTGSGATNIASAYFTAASGRITVAVTGSASLHYQEAFAGETDGATSNTLPPWSVTQTPSSGTFEKQTPTIFFGADGFEINNTGVTEGVWETADLDFSSATYPEIYISVDVFVTSTSVTDYVDVAYVWDAEGPGSENLIQSVTTTTASPSITLPTAGHSKIRLVIRAKENTAGNVFIIFPREFNFTNVNILGMRNLYSRANNNWYTSGTWSTVGIGGVDCACTPSLFGSDRIFIGGGNLVTLDNHGYVASLTVNGTADAGGAGTLQYGANFELNPMLVNSTITVNNGGQINDAGNPNSTFTFSVDNTQSIVNNGTISVGDIRVTGSTFYAPTITLSGSGATTLTDDLTITGSNFGNNNASFTNSGTGAFTVTGTSTLDDGTYTDSDNTSITTFIGNVSQSGNSIFAATAVTATGNLVFRGGITNTGTTFNAGGATFNTNNQTLSGTLSFANIVTVNTPTVITNNGTVTMSNTGTGVLAGTGTWSQGTGTLNFAGSTMTVATLNASTAGNTVNYNSTVPQTIKAPATTYDILTLNNSSATIPSLTVSGNITVATTLNFTNGIVNLDGNTFTLGSSGVASDMNRTASTTTKWMYGGPFTRWWPTGQTPSPTGGNLYGLFPLGHSTASSYRPVAITAGSNITTTGSVTFRHVDASGITDLSPVYDDDPGAPIVNIVRKHNSQFIGSTSGIVGGTNYTISVTMTGLLAGTASDIRLAVSNGATTVTNAGTHVANSGTAPSPVVGRSGLTVANLTNDFRITTINSTNTPLPIELLDFNAKQVDSQVVLNWSTASELNNDFFTIESLNAEDSFDEVVRVKGSGTINESRSYQGYDLTPKAGKNYYRLKQTDFDGQFSYSKILMVDFNEIGEAVNIYPNPVNQKTLSIEVKQLKSGQQVPLQIRSMLGVQTFSASYNADSTGRIRVSIQVDQWSKGLYLVQIGTDTPVQRKIVIE